jgi:4-hydroxy-tetrahydrodipicolinate reductase
VRVAVAGATGRVGRFIAEAIEAAPDLALVARIAPSLSAAGAGCYGLLGEAITHARPDVLVDFTRPDLIAAHAAIAVEAGVPLVMGTTGLTAEERGTTSTWPRASAACRSSSPRTSPSRRC